MKSIRRHELKENVLAHDLVQVKQFLAKYGNRIFILVAVAAIVLLVVWQYRSRGIRRFAQDKADLERLLYDPELKGPDQLSGLEDLAGRARDRLTAGRAALEAGAIRLERSQAEMLNSQPAKAREEADKAAEYFRLVIGKYADLKPLVVRAHLGLGTLAADRGDEAAAAAEYAEARKGTANTPGVLEAERRLARMSGWFPPVRFAATLPATQPATLPAGAPTTGPAAPPAGAAASKPAAAPAE